MPITPETITEKLHAKADEELKAEIKAAFAPMWEYTKWGDGSLNTRIEHGDAVIVNMSRCRSDIEDYAFNSLKDRRREAKVVEFMERLESLGQECQEIRDAAGL